MTWSVNDTLKQGPRPGGPSSPDAPPMVGAATPLPPTWTDAALPTPGSMAETLGEGDEEPLRYPMDVRQAMAHMGLCPDETWQHLGHMMRRGVVEI